MEEGCSNAWLKNIFCLSSFPIMLTTTANLKLLPRPHIYMLFYYASDITMSLHTFHIFLQAVWMQTKKEALRNESFLENSPVGLVSATVNSCN